MILDDIHDKLAEIDPLVFYGAEFDPERVSRYDYLVFGRETLTPADTGTALTDRVWVAIVREGYIPDGLPERVIDAVTSLPGVRLSKQSFDYDYTAKPGTNQSIELLRLVFSRARKR